MKPNAGIFVTLSCGLLLTLLPGCRRSHDATHTKDAGYQTELRGSPDTSERTSGIEQSIDESENGNEKHENDTLFDK